MSLELHIFLRNSCVPDRSQWQVAIEQLGFPTVLDPTLDVRKDTGFSPTTYAGKETGFEFYLESAADLLSSYGHIAAHIGNRDHFAASVGAATSTR